MWQWRNDNPYGNNLAQGNIEFNLRFAGQYYDAESRLHYNIHRTYNPELGRYMQSDPLGLLAGSNTYNYVERNPFDAVDPLGLDTVPMGLMTKNQGYIVNAMFAIEIAKKITNDSNHNVLNILSHGSGNSLHGLLYNQLGEQIISGNFETDSGIIKNDYFDIMLREGKPIIINLEACGTGIKRYGFEVSNSKKEKYKYPDGSSFQEDLINYLKNDILNKQKNNPNIKNVKIIINAPSGATDGLGGYLSDWGLKDIVSPMSRGDGKDSSGKWEHMEVFIP